MTAISREDRETIECCKCGTKFSIPKDTASDLTIPKIMCPFCGINGILVRGCRR